jgi:phosphatidate cytidylyltransferase
MTRKPGRSNLFQRIAVAVVGIPLVFSLIALGGLYFLALIELVMSVSLFEFYRLAESRDFHPSKTLGIAAIFFIGLAAHYQRVDWIVLGLLALTIGTLLVELFKNKPHAIGNTAITVFGVQYLSLFGFFLPLRRLGAGSDSETAGVWLVFAVLVSIWICDTAAYGFGKLFGKHTLFKRVSPKKTWEGAAAGFVCAVATAFFFRAFRLSFLAWYDALFFGAAAGIIGQISDLVESLFKRDAGAKDSSGILPGHGGFLDRFDSPLLVVPVVYVYLLFRHLP